MKTKNFFRLLSLVMFVSLCAVSCDKDKNGEKDEKKATVNITVINAKKPVEGKIVYLFSNEKSIKDIVRKDILTFEETDKDGVAKFVFNENQLNGDFKKTFYFACALRGDEDKDYDYAHDFCDYYAEVALKAGDVKSDTIDITPKKDDEPVIAEQLKFSNLIVQANVDGTISIGGTITTNTKLKEFALRTEDGKQVVYDFLSDNQQIKEKNANLEENGKASNERQFTLDIVSASVPINNYQLVIKTKNDKKLTETIGEVLVYKIGAAKSYIGSYLSIVNNRCYGLEDAKVHAVELVAVSSADGLSVEGLRKATSAKSKDVAAMAGKVVLFQNYAVTETITAGGIIITESGCICKVNTIDNNTDSEATIKAVTIRNDGSLKVDVSRIQFTE